MRETVLVEVPTAERPVGAGGALVSGALVTLKFQFPPPLLSQVPAPLLNTKAIVVALEATL